MIRSAVMDDFDTIYTMSKKNTKLLGPIMPPEIRSAIVNNNCLLYISNDNTIAGFVLFRRLKRTLETTVQIICVDEKFRGNGIGKCLISYLLDLYKVPIKATCVKDTSSEKFWNSIGIKYEEQPGKVRPICRYRVVPKTSVLKSLF